MLSNVKKNLGGQEGQAVFELVIFVPIFVALLTFFIAVGSAINASINQQKALRGYFYYYQKGNSRLFTNEDLRDLSLQSPTLFVLGWQNEERDNVPIAACFRLSSLFGSIGPEGETCENKSEELISQYIRVYTAYGICGENFILRGNQYVSALHLATLSSFATCANY